MIESRPPRVDSTLLSEPRAVLPAAVICAA